MQRSLNKLDTELAITQAASMLLGDDAAGASESFIYVDMWAAVHMAHALMNDDDECHAETADGAEADPEADQVQAPIQASVAGELEHAPAHACTRAECVEVGGAPTTAPVPSVARPCAGIAEQIELTHLDDNLRGVGTCREDPMGAPNVGSARLYAMGGAMIPVAWIEHYQHRGDALRSMPYVVYCLVIQIVEAPDPQADADSDRATRTTPAWHFGDGHPLRLLWIQKARSKFKCPLHAGESPPSLPAALGDGEVPSRSWQTSLMVAVNYCVANFIPWDGAEPVASSEHQLRRFIAAPRSFVTVGYIDGLAREDGHGARGELDGKHEREVRICAAGVVQLLRNHMRGLSIPRTVLDYGKQYRFVNRHQWSDEEKHEHSKTRGEGSQYQRDAQREIDELKSRQEARRYDMCREQLARSHIQWLNKLETALQVATAANVGAFTQPGEGSMHTTWPTEHREADVRAVAERFGDTFDDAVSMEAPTGIVAPPQAFTSAEMDTPPPAFMPLDDDQYKLEKSAWTEACNAAKQAGEPSPLPPLNPEQRKAGMAILRVVRCLGHAMKTAATMGYSRFQYTKAVSDAHQLHFLLAGAPGTGKSQMLKTVLQVMEDEDLGGAVFSAYTGVAVTQLPRPAATYCKLTGINGDAGSELGEVPPASATHLSVFNAIVRNARRLLLLVVDEVSFLGTPHLHHLDRRMRQLLDCELPFGGLVVVLPGDFHQLMPVMGFALHHSLVVNALDDATLKTLDITKGKQSANGADRKGSQLMKGFRRLRLTQQMRAADDEVHAAHVAQMRDVDSTQAVCDELIAAFRPLTPAAIAEEARVEATAAVQAAIAREPSMTEAQRKAVAREAATRTEDAMRFAKIGVLSQRERHSFNLIQARAFARRHGRVLFKWRHELTGIAASWLTDAETERLYREELAMLWGYFVEGAPCSLTNNLETGRGMVNGCDGAMHSVQLGDDAGASLDAYIRSGVVVDGVLEVELPVPLSINVEPSVGHEATVALLAREATLDASGRLLVPILVGKRCEDVTPISLYAAQAAIPKKLMIKKHQVDLAFAVTDCTRRGCLPSFCGRGEARPHVCVLDLARADKVQGKTLDYFILSIGPREVGLFPKLKLADLHVLVSRVRLGRRLFVLGFDPDDVAHAAMLRRLEHSYALAVWENSYDEHGMWSDTMARCVASEYVADIRGRRRA